MAKKIIKKVKENLKSDTQKIKEEVQEKSLGYIGAGLGVVAGLAWNDAIKGLIELVFPTESEGVMVQFFYAIIITLAVVIIMMYLSRLFKK